QGILDLNGSGSDLYSGLDGKAIHLVATADIADLSAFGLSVANNGGGSDGVEYTLSGSASAGDDILVYRVGDGSSSSTFFADYFGDCFSQFDVLIPTGLSFPDGNGDDPVELFENGVVIDFYGDVDGAAINGDPYEDGWTYKLEDGTWLDGGEDCDVESPEDYSVISSGCPYPICNFGTQGCTDQTAFNYNPEATIDDGSCILNLTNGLSLQGVLDFDLGSTGGKAIHLKANTNISDLSIFAIGTANNGGGSDGPEFTFESISVSSGDEILVVRDDSAMSIYMGSCYSEFDHIIHQNISAINQNGNDAIELFENGIIIETFGDANVDGTGEDWEYTDSWAYLVDSTWTYGGLNCTDSTNSIFETSCVYPICPQEEVCSVPNSWDVTVTATNQTIILPSNTLISIDDQLTIDEIAIGLFFVNQIGELQCAGYTYFSGETSQIAAFGDDTTTDEIDGFQEGQEFTWLIYNCISGETYNANGSFSNGPSVYTTNGISYVNTVTTAPSGPESQTVNLPNGWSMFSTYMIPENTALDQLLSSVVNEVIIAKDYLGAAYLPEFNFNGVGAIQVGQGYQIKMSSEQNLVVDGEYAFPEDNPISFNSGWNMIGYLRIDAAPADLVLAQLVDNNNLIIAKDFLGAAYLPEFNFNGIGDLNPGRGYQIKTNTDGILELLSNDISYRVSSHKALINKTNFFTKPTITDKNMTLVLNLNNLKKLSGNFEIAAFDKENKIVGSSKIFFPITVFPVWVDDVLNNFKDGLYNNEEIYFQIWNGKDLKKINLTSNNELILFNTNDIVNIDGVEISSKVNTDKISIYPNPSSQFSSVEIYLNQSSIVEIDLYDMMGNFIRRIISEEYGEGNNLININIENIPDGSYFLKIKHDQKIINKHFKIIN
ncbi:MAG: T9SS C-terminal target domain-containing protein, partial [Flavobacteriales bacterium TMED288]